MNELFPSNFSINVYEKLEKWEKWEKLKQRKENLKTSNYLVIVKMYFKEVLLFKKRIFKFFVNKISIGSLTFYGSLNIRASCMYIARVALFRKFMTSWYLTLVSPDSTTTRVANKVCNLNKPKRHWYYPMKKSPYSINYIEHFTQIHLNF